jgi:cytochrome c heme-lyase
MGQSQSSTPSTQPMASAHTMPTSNTNIMKSSPKPIIDNNEPVDKPDRNVNSTTQQSTYYTTQQDTDDLIDPTDILGEYIPDSAIPAAGRGNSEDGRKWLNPSANQLYRALKRKNKPIEKSDALQVATVHNAVTDNTWVAIQEYEQLHSSQCSNSTLSKFQGMDGIYSIKAKLVSMLTGGQLPFDRHDWYVDRCGTEVKYVIDYYSVEDMNVETGEVDIAYYIDARPAPTVAGLFDRARLSLQKYKAGESVW